MGDIITNPPTTPNTVSDSWQPLVDRDTMGYFGKNKITLTNWDASTTAPAIAQGSTIDINGSIARFDADEAIGGAPADGTVYLMFVVAVDTVTAEWTAEAPTWAADKGGWYTAAGNRCSGHIATKSGTAYSEKRRWRDEYDGSYSAIYAGLGIRAPLYINGINTDNKAIKAKFYTGTLNASGDVFNVPLNLGTVTFGRIISAIGSTSLNGEYYTQGTNTTIKIYDNTHATAPNTFSIAGSSDHANGKYMAVLYYTEDGV